MNGRLSLYQQHVERWGRGCGSAICEGARVCLARGKVPSDVVLVGEAPGESENVIGRPFVGPAGKLLDVIVSKAMAGAGVSSRDGLGLDDTTPYPTYADRHQEVHGRRPIDVAYTNLVGCIPRYEHGPKAAEPDQGDILKCRDRLAEFVTEVARPRLIVCVGALARKWLDKVVPHRDARSVDIQHPAAILRANSAQRGLLVQRAVVILTNAFEEL